METLFCDACEEFFETTEDMANTILQEAANSDTCHKLVLCTQCILEAFAEEQDDMEFYDETLCYDCGNNLEVGVDPPGDVCYDCAYEEGGLGDIEDRTDYLEDHPILEN